MRVAINAVAVTGGGGRTFLVELAAALAEVGAAHEWFVIRTQYQSWIDQELPTSFTPVVCDGAPESAWRRVVWEQKVLPGVLGRLGADVCFAAFNVAPLFTRVPVVLGIQSVNAFSRLPIGWPALVRLRHVGLRWLGRWGAARARYVVFPSETAARWLARVLHVDTDRARVVHYGWRAPRCEGGDDRPRSQPYILCVASLLEHRNLETLLDAFEIASGAGGYGGELVIVGGPAPGFPQYALALERHRRRLRCADRVHFHGDVASSDLPAFYRGADLSVFPSLEETFGLPLVEAMGWGTPVAATDWRLHPDADDDRPNVGPEICGDAAEYFDPMDPAAMASAMTRVLSNATATGQRVAIGRARAAQFSWRNAARQTIDLLEAAVAGGHR